MQRTNRAVGFALAVAAAIILVGSTRRLAACLTDPVPRDKTYVLDKGDCGSFQWELEAQYGVLWDEGPAEGSGACAGGYYTCQCTHVAPYEKNATESFQYSYTGQPGIYDIWWNITNYNEPSDTYCDPTVQCNGQDAVKSESVTSWVDYNEGYDEVDCQGR